MKNSLIPTGIEPATFRFVEQRLNHCDTAVSTCVDRESGYCCRWWAVKGSRKDRSPTSSCCDRTGGSFHTGRNKRTRSFEQNDVTHLREFGFSPAALLQIQEVWEVQLCISGYFEELLCLQLQGQAVFLGSSVLNMKTLQYVETSGCTHPTTKRNIWEQLNSSWTL